MKGAPVQKDLPDALAPRSGGVVPIHKAPWRGDTESKLFSLVPRRRLTRALSQGLTECGSNMAGGVGNGYFGSERCGFKSRRV
jgi:hypothetical protein